MREVTKLLVIGLAVATMANPAAADDTRSWKEREAAKKAQQKAERVRLQQEEAAERERLQQEEAVKTVAAPPPVVPVFEGETTKVQIEYTAPKYSKECNVYWEKGGPIAGTTISPLFMGGGAGMAAASGGDKVLLGVGVAMAVGGLVGTIVSGYLLRERNRKRYAQRLLGCPSYK